MEGATGALSRNAQEGIVDTGLQELVDRVAMQALLVHVLSTGFPVHKLQNLQCDTATPPLSTTRP